MTMCGRTEGLTGMITWNTFLGTRINVMESAAIDAACRRVARRLGYDYEELESRDGVGLPLDVLREMPAEMLFADSSRGADSGLAKSMAAAVRNYAALTGCTVGVHGSSRPEDTRVVAVRLPVSALEEIDEGWQTRSECVRAALACAKNMGLF